MLVSLEREAGVQSELCAPRNDGIGSVAAEADPIGARGCESVGRASLSMEGDGSRGCRGSRAVATDCLAVGTAGSGGLKP